MPTPVKWSAADFKLINSESPEGGPWLAASPDLPFNLTFFESFTSPPAYTGIELRDYPAAGGGVFIGNTRIGVTGGIVLLNFATAQLANQIIYA